VLRWPRRRRTGAPVLGVDQERIAWAAGAGAEEDAGVTSMPYGGHPAPEELPSEATARAVHVIAGNDVATYWMQEPPSAVSSLMELRLVATSRCARLFGGEPGDWSIAGDWQLDRPFVCAALPRGLVQTVEGNLGYEPRWHTAWGVLNGYLANSLPSDGWCAVRTPSRTVLWHCADGHVDYISALITSGQADSQTVALQSWQQSRLEQLREGFLPGEPLHFLDLVVGAEEADWEIADVRRISPPPGLTTAPDAGEAEGAALLGCFMRRTLA